MFIVMLPVELRSKLIHITGIKSILRQNPVHQMNESKHLKGCSGPRVGNLFGPNIPEVIRDPSSVRFCDFFSSHFCFEFFSSLNLKKGTPRGYMEQRAILAPTNKIRDNINAFMMNRLPTEEVVLLSADSTVQPGDSDRYPTEMLNSLQPQGLPAHKLVLRPGAPLRLMRNLNPKDGLCNGTRMMFVRVINNKVCSLQSVAMH